MFIVCNVIKSITLNHYGYIEALYRDPRSNVKQYDLG